MWPGVHLDDASAVRTILKLNEMLGSADARHLRYLPPVQYLGTVGTDRTVGNPSCVYSYPEQQPYAATPSAASRIT